MRNEKKTSPGYNLHRRTLSKLILGLTLKNSNYLTSIFNIIILLSSRENIQSISTMDGGAMPEEFIFFYDIFGVFLFFFGLDFPK